MKLGFIVFGILFLSSCTPIYILFNKQKVRENDKQIMELSKLINNEDYISFLNKLKINNDLIYSAKDTLGFGYYRDVDNRYYNDELGFATTIIRRNDSVISMSVYPHCGSIISQHYKKKYKKAGWQIEPGVYRDNFKEKLCGFENSIVTVKDTTFNYKPKSNLHIDSLMSPLIFNSSYFNTIKDSLTENDLLYLMHSINPVTRLIAAKYIKCSDKQVSAKTSRWMNHVKHNSPKFKTFVSHCVVEDKSYDFFLNCK